MGEPARNLLIVHSSGYEDISDWDEVKRRIDAQAPDIEVRIANNFARNSVTRGGRSGARRWFAQAIWRSSVRRGTLYVGHQLTKLEQFERLARQAPPTPQTMRLTPEAQWGPYVVVKPPSLAKACGCSLSPRGTSPRAWRS